MSRTIYKMSFTTRPPLAIESTQIAQLYLELGDWQAVRDKVEADNLLQLRSVSSRDRLVREIIARLRHLNPPELKLLVQGTSQDQTGLLWLAICRQYTFIADFTLEILGDHVAALDYQITKDDFDLFFARKAEWHSELQTLSESTTMRLRRNLFKMLREAELIDSQFRIRPIALSPALRSLIESHDLQELRLFPGLIQ
jgi:hypothetical protein